MYEIHLTCFDPPYNEVPNRDKVEKVFKTETEVRMALLECMLEEVASLNEPDVYFTPRTDIFVPQIGYEYAGKKYAGAILMWDGAADVREQVVTLYDIRQIDKEGAANNEDE